MRKVVGVVVGALVLLGMTGAGIETLRDAVAEGGSVLPAILLLALPALAVGVLVAVALQRLIRPLRARTGVVAVIALAVAGVLGVGVFAANRDIPLQRPDAAVTAAVAPACVGRAIPAAGRVTDGTARVNHVVVLDPTGAEFGWTGKPSVAWRPATVDDVELVACVQAEDQLAEIEVCTYNGPSTTRYAATREFRVVAARTGAELARISITDEPGSCPAVKSQDLPEMKGEVSWALVADHLESLVTGGRFVDPDPDPGPAWSPESTTEPWGSEEPIVTPRPTDELRELSLAAAIDQGLVTAKGTGDSLQSLDLTITSKADVPLEITVPAGTVLVPKRAATQTMVVIATDSIEVPARETVRVELDVACAQMHDDQPGEAGKADSFTVRDTAAGGDLAKLLRGEAFAAADFRIQQFAIWTITSNPTKSGYVRLGTFGVGSGPSAAELRDIKAILQDAGISTARYRALP